MQQAVKTDTTLADAASAGKIGEFSTRRQAIAAIGGMTLAIAVPVSATSRRDWSAGDWLARWGRLGCGARLGAAGHPALTPRLDGASQNRACAVMLGELTGARLALIASALREARPF